MATKGRQHAEVVAWLRAAESAFAEDKSIMFKPFTKPGTFLAFLVEARRQGLEYVSLSSTGDRHLAAKMAQAEQVLIGADRCHCAVLELIRWFVLDRPRPRYEPLCPAVTH